MGRREPERGRSKVTADSTSIGAVKAEPPGVVCPTSVTHGLMVSRWEEEEEEEGVWPRRRRKSERDVPFEVETVHESV